MTILRVSIRPFQIQDLDAICEIEQKVFTTPWSRQSFLDCARWSEFWFYVAVWDEKIVGYFITQVVGEEAELYNIAVDPSFHDQGIGKKLMEFFLEKGSEENVENIFLMVRPSNVAAIKLYENFEFSLFDRRKKYYQDNQEDALIFYRRMPKIIPVC
ncbi:MAG: ribosomal protein S18-alanine N-acetyltransferase [Deltaproteobacteria bacterium]|nr:ribosomal protein S18-alanine N-acetyltransferase [Deltaproteobacteria bacterium]